MSALNYADLASNLSLGSTISNKILVMTSSSGNFLTFESTY
jgi:hypothetical protein